MELKRSTYDAFLPPTPCLSATREQIDAIAKANNTSVAAVMRAAVSLFLQGYPHNLRDNNEKSETKEHKS